jgi:hypothetical protein
MSALPFLPWRPGLPSEPCVCDVRLRSGRVLLNVTVGEVLGTFVVRPDGVGRMVGARIPADPYACALYDAPGTEWRPIPIPDGIAFAPIGGTSTR